MSTQTIDKNLGYIELYKQLRILENDPFVKVGLLAKSGKHKGHNKGQKATVVQIGMYHEFGTAITPERSFIRKTHDEKRRSWEKETDFILFKIQTRRMTVKTGLAVLGLLLVKDVKNKIRNGDASWPPVTPERLKQKTVNGKVGFKTLIDTAQMLNSINYEVVIDGRNSDKLETGDV